MKKMKYLLVSSLIFGLTITGCGETKTSPTENGSQPSTSTPAQSNQDSKSDTSVAPVDEDIQVVKVEFEGLTDIEVNKGTAVNPKSGVVAKAFYTENGQEKSFVVTSYLTVTQGDQTLSTACNTQTVGEYTLVYKVDTSRVVGFAFPTDLKLEATRKLVVKEVEVSTEELIVNGDFAEGGEHWGNFVDGSTCEFDFSEGYMKCVETAVSANSYSPRLNTPYPNSEEEFTLVYGTTYLVSLDLKADVNRSVVVQLGTILPASPYWVANYDTEGNDLVHVFDITNEWKTYTWMFTLDSATNEQTHLTLEMGGTAAGVQQPATTIYADNISIKAAQDDGVDRVAPQFGGVENARVDFADEGTFDVLAGISASDNVDGDVTSNITYVIKKDNQTEVDSIPLNEEAAYTIVYTIKDAAGNEKTATRTVKVAKPVSVYTPVYNEGKTEVTFAGENDKADDTLVYWNDQNWCGQTVTVSEAYEEENKYHFSYKAEGKAQWGAGFQIFYNNSNLEDGNEYTVSFTLESTAAGKIRVNGQEVEIVAGSNDIEITYTEGVSSLAIINGVFEAEFASPTIDEATFVLSNIEWRE